MDRGALRTEPEALGPTADTVGPGTVPGPPGIGAGGPPHPSMEVAPKASPKEARPVTPPRGPPPGEFGTTGMGSMATGSVVSDEQMAEGARWAAEVDAAHFGLAPGTTAGDDRGADTGKIRKIDSPLVAARPKSSPSPM